MDLDKYSVIDLICGKQITTLTGRDGASKLRYSVFPADLQETLREYASSGGNMLISGANIATDAWDKIYDYQIDSLMMAEVVMPMREFITGVLKYKWMTNNATVGCDVRMVQNPFGLPLSSYSFFTKPNPYRYQIESPDGLVPADKNAYTIFRYSDNNISAGVAYEGDYRVVALGFPIETLQSQEQIDKIIKELMGSLIISSEFEYVESSCGLRGVPRNTQHVPCTAQNYSSSALRLIKSLSSLPFSILLASRAKSVTCLK